MKNFKVVLLLTILFFGTFAIAGIPTSLSASPVKSQVKVTPKNLIIQTSKYGIEISKSPFSLFVYRGSDPANVVLAGRSEGFSHFKINGSHGRLTNLINWKKEDDRIVLTIATTIKEATTVVIAPKLNKFIIQETLQSSTTPTLFGFTFKLSSGHHWYGLGECESEEWCNPWPLETEIISMTISPGSYMMVEPFLFTSTATGFWEKAEKVIDVTINSEKDVVEFLTHNTSELDYTVFVDSTVLGVYKSFIDIVGKPLRIHAKKLYFEEPVWSTWAQFYETVNQANVLSFARAIKQAGLPGHTIQIDDRWESDYGNMEFDKTKFPSPKKMVAELHAMGFKVALWVTLWSNVGTMSYKEGLANDYFLRSRKNPSKSLMCRWWNGVAGITDIGKPEAYEWAVRRLKHLQEAYNIDGFKFDTRFYDERGKPYGNLVPTDYLKIGAKLVDEFDHVGVGVRLSWGLQGYGFTTRQHDKHSTWNAQSGLRGYIDQNLAISIIGYPFVTLDMTGGSLGDPPPDKQFLIRCMEVEAFQPIQYNSTLPTGVRYKESNRYISYDSQTVELFKKYALLHKYLSPYFYELAQEAITTGLPILQPIFFHYPSEEAYTIDNEYLVGKGMLVAPVITKEAVSRNIFLPKGRWIDYWDGNTYDGPINIENYPSPLDKIPFFILATPECICKIFVPIVSEQMAELVSLASTLLKENRIPSHLNDKIQDIAESIRSSKRRDHLWAKATANSFQKIGAEITKLREEYIIALDAYQKLSNNVDRITNALKFLEIK